MQLIRNMPLLIVTGAMLIWPLAASASEESHGDQAAGQQGATNNTTMMATMIGDPTVAPTLSVGAGTSTLAAGTYTVGYAWRANGGTTLLSPTAVLTIAAGQTIAVLLPAFPAGVSNADIFMSVGPNSGTLALVANTATGIATLSDVPLSNAVAPPTANSTAPGAVNGDDNNNDDGQMNDEHGQSNDGNKQHREGGESDHHHGGD